MEVLFLEVAIELMILRVTVLELQLAFNHNCHAAISS